MNLLLRGAERGGNGLNLPGDDLLHPRCAMPACSPDYQFVPSQETRHCCRTISQFAENPIGHNTPAGFQ